METNILVNKQHYDHIYEQTQIENIVHKAIEYKTFLDDAIKTDTSWHGMYYGGFRDRLAGKRILELGSGDGLNAIIMALLGGDVIANDISGATELIINEINNQIGTRVRPLTGDFRLMEFEAGSFDFIVGKAFLHHLTHDLENEYLYKVSMLLKEEGEARFFEPAMNSKSLDRIRWLIPVPGRPSVLNKMAFQVWKENDPHPLRDNSSQHFQEVGKLYFDEINIILIGSIERFCRLLPAGKINRIFRRWAHRIETTLPMWFRYPAARSQLIIFREPHH